MQKENYVSGEVENILVHDFMENSLEQGMWIGRSIVLYVLLIKIFKYKIESNIGIDFNNSIKYLFDNYKILNDKNLLSLEEIKNYEEFLKNISGVELMPEKIKYSELSEELFMYIGMSITEYLSKSSFVKDFFHMQKNIENF